MFEISLLRTNKSVLRRASSTWPDGRSPDHSGWRLFEMTVVLHSRISFTQRVIFYFFYSLVQTAELGRLAENIMLLLLSIYGRIVNNMIIKYK